MTTTTPTLFSFLLIDGALVGGAAAYLPLGQDGRPDWATPLYEDPEAASVSPLLIDIAAAQQAGPLEQMMALMNAMRPQLHVSIIDTALPNAELVRHLRRFIYITTEADRQLTLRFADCAVLPALASVLSPTQWATLAEPIARWRVHQRDGALATLPPAARGQNPAPTPLALASAQIDELSEAMAPDRLILNVQASRPTSPLPGTALQQHRWASHARALWRGVGHADDNLLISFTSAVFDTQGKLLRHPHLPAILDLQDAAAIRQRLREILKQY